MRERLYQRVIASLMRRLAPVCSHMDAHEFEALVRRAAEIQIKYQQRRDYALHQGSGELE